MWPGLSDRRATAARPAASFSSARKRKWYSAETPAGAARPPDLCDSYNERRRHEPADSPQSASPPREERRRFDRGCPTSRLCTTGVLYRGDAGRPGYCYRPEGAASAGVTDGAASSAMEREQNSDPGATRGAATWLSRSQAGARSRSIQTSGSCAACLLAWRSRDIARFGSWRCVVCDRRLLVTVGRYETNPSAALFAVRRDTQHAGEAADDASAPSAADTREMGSKRGRDSARSVSLSAARPAESETAGGGGGGAVSDDVPGRVLCA